MAIDFSYIDHDVLGDVADAIRFVEGSTASIAPSDYPNRIRALDKYIPDYSVLNFTMPNGGTISLNKNGNPTVVELEYWLDENRQWLIWQQDSNGNRSLVLSAGQRMYLRNTSETSTGFSIDSSNYYFISSSEIKYANGNINSLLCRNPEDAVLTNSCFRRLFYNDENLITPPDMPALILANNCYMTTYYQCVNLIKTPYLPCLTLANDCYRSMFLGCKNIEDCIIAAVNYSENSCLSMFYECSKLKKLEVYVTDVSVTQSISTWLYGVATTGDFYCPAELTIPTGVSGIPTGWTRHDINELNS